MSCCSEAVICGQREVLSGKDEGIQSTGICRGQQSPPNNKSASILKTCVAHLQLNVCGAAGAKTMALWVDSD